MLNSPYKVFVVLKNLDAMIKDGKNVGVFDEVNRGRFKNSNQYCKKHYTRIHTEIEKKYYTYKDLIIYYLYQNIFNKSVDPKNINNVNVNITVGLFSEKQYEKDVRFLMNLNNQTYPELSNFFKIQKNGEPYIYDFIMKKQISPFLVLKYRKSLTSQNENDIFKNEEYKSFENIINIFLKIFQTGG